MESFRTIVSGRVGRRVLRGRRELPSTIVTYINNNSGTVKDFCGFVRSRKIRLVNYRTTKEKVSAFRATTAMGANHLNVFRNVGSCFYRSGCKRVTPICSVSTKLSCPKIKPRRTCLRSVKETGCMPMASSRTMGTFRCLTGARKVVPTVRSSRTITCTVGLTPAVSGSGVVIIAISNENSGSYTTVTECEKRGVCRWSGGYI